MRGNPEQGPKAGLTPRLQVYDAEAWFARATAAGASDAMRCDAMRLENMFWGDRDR